MVDVRSANMKECRGFDWCWMVAVFLVLLRHSESAYYIALLRHSESAYYFALLRHSESAYYFASPRWRWAT
jgi:hypothetical protein